MLTHFRPRVRSRHPSHSVLRHQNNNLPMMPFRSRIRLGSTTEVNDRFPVVELNSIDAIKNSSNKYLMKTRFTDNGVKTANWWTYRKTELDSGFVKEDGSNDNTLISIEDLTYPIISKNIYGSRGTGNKKHDNKESLESWLEGKNIDNYIFEKFHNYAREYRLHISEDGCFYTCRKMLKRDTPNEHKWYRNDDHCVWILEDNDLFDRPVNWDSIVEESIKALKAVGLDFGAVDVKIQSASDSSGNTRENPEFIIVEINSAPSFGEKTAERYIEEIPKLLTRKHNAQN